MNGPVPRARSLSREVGTVRRAASLLPIRVVRGSSARGPILIVEDNDETRDAMVRILALRGFWSVTAGDGAAALHYLRSAPNPAVIVLDIRMPVMDGTTLRAKLAANPEWAAIPIVVFSAALPEQPLTDVVASIRKGSADPDVLLAAIDRAAGRSDE